MRNIQQIADECIKKLKDIDIPIQDDKIIDIDFYKTRSLGRCLKTTDDRYLIKVSSMYENEDIDLNELYATVIHELIHTCKDCMHHGDKWLQYAHMADSVYGYGIVGYKTFYDIRHTEKPVLGRMECMNCIGYWDVREPKSWKQIKNGEKYYCGWCGCEMRLDGNQ